VTQINIIIGFIAVGVIVASSLIVRSLAAGYTGKLRKLTPSSQLVGRKFVKRVIRAENIDVKLDESEGGRKGEFLFKKGTVKIPEPDRSSLLTLGIAAHELAHAVQADRKKWLVATTIFLVRLGVFLSYIFPLVLIAGFVFYHQLLYLSLILYSFIVLVVLVKIPLEIDANVKALSYLDDYCELTEMETTRLKKLLGLAILTRLTDLTVGFLVLIDLTEKR